MFLVQLLIVLALIIGTAMLLIANFIGLFVLLLISPPAMYIGFVISLILWVYLLSWAFNIR